jgi:nucleotide-binding universal stress UspA family protein
MFRRFLVGLSKSPQSEVVIPFVARLAAAVGATVDLVQVVPPIPDHLSDGNPSLQNPSTDTQVALRWLAMQDKERHQETLRLETLTKQFLPFQAHFRLLVGTVPETLLEEASRVEDTVVALTSRGRGKLSETTGGSVVGDILLARRYPVVVVNASYSPLTKLGAVVAALDGSPLAETALPPAEQLARSLELPLTIARVVPIRSKVALTEARHDMEAVKNRLMQQQNANVITSVLSGNPARELARFAESKRGLLVMTTLGRTGISSMVVGSVVRSVIRGTTTPVLVIPNDEPDAVRDLKAALSAQTRKLRSLWEQYAYVFAANDPKDSVVEKANALQQQIGIARRRIRSLANRLGNILHDP